MTPEDELISRVADGFLVKFLAPRGESSRGRNKDGGCGVWDVDVLAAEQDDDEEADDGTNDCDRFVRMICAFSMSLLLMSPPTTPMIVVSSVVGCDCRSQLLKLDGC
jgi:hypothetical protein